ncbi:hypothetical protein WICMUC_002365 [Wickerhamomyces mucosus]|uniref:37S ribosomal protein S35, mitochondrial n=1 Tax=Wickerhamomyces mucosus TaxID=1378264 RepID=A0A9P8TE06_9ASCO|nr:hypothetical protein WICMUC_002365 [Wickerhamomyces mucosus]
MIISNNQLTGKAYKLSNACHQQARNFSRRRIAYPFYSVPRMGRTHEKDHKTNLKHQMALFLGKKNFKGEYTSNKYFEASNNHKPKYINPDRESGSPLINPKTGEALDYYGNKLILRQNQRERNILAPFPTNEFCQTNLALSETDKEEIYKKIVIEKLPIQDVAVSFGIRIPRLEAVARLKEIEKRLIKEKKITEEMKSMAQTMYKMFPLFERPVHSENLSEIPVPVKTLQSRFLTIAESEPFGPVDAAKVLGLEPAEETLKKLAETGGHSTITSSKANEKQIFTAKQNEKDRFVFKFTKAKVGEVGFRYGTTLRDNKKDRKFTFDNSGKMINALPISG